MEKDDKKFEVKFIGKEATKKMEQKVISKIGEDKDAVSFVSGKILLLLIYEVCITVIFLISLFVSFAEKDILSIILNIGLVIIFISSVIENISLINKLGKTQVSSK